MPFAATCSDHPGVSIDGTTEAALAHLREAHPGANLEDGPVRFAFTRQTVAQGTPDRRRYRCRRCAVSVDTTDPNPTPYCEDCT